MLRATMIHSLLIVGLILSPGCRQPNPPQPNNPVVPGPAGDGPKKEGNAKGSPAFTPDGASWHTKETKVLDADKVGAVFAGTWQVSPDGKRWAYAAKEDRTFYWVIDGKRLDLKLDDENDKPLQCVSPGSFAFSGDSKHYLIGASFSGNNRERIGLSWDGSNMILEKGSGPTVWLSEDGSEYAWVGRGIASIAYHADTRFLHVNGTQVAQIAPDFQGGGSLTVVAGKKISWIVKSNNFVVNGKAIPLPGGNLGYVLTGGGYAVITSEENTQFAIVKGKPQKRFSSIVPNSLAISEDGQHYALAGQDSGKYYVQHDNVWHELPGAPVTYQPPGGYEKRIDPNIPPAITLSSDGKSWACIVVDSGGKPLDRTVIVNGKAGKKYASPSRPVFSPDGQHYAYHAVTFEEVEKKEGDKKTTELQVFAVLVKDGVEKRIAALPHRVALDQFQLPDTMRQTAASITDLTYSPDGKSLAYVINERSTGKVEGDAPNSPKTVMVDDAVIGKKSVTLHDKIRPMFSPDSKSLAYVIRDKGEWYVVLDGKERGGWEVLAPDATRVGFTPAGAFTYLGKRDGAVYWVEESRK